MLTVASFIIWLLYSCVQRGKLKRGQSVLIHAGSGGVGQAAINIAHYYGCEIFTTVGTQEKRDFIKKQFPMIDGNIAKQTATYLAC